MKLSLSAQTSTGVNNDNKFANIGLFGLFGLFDYKFTSGCSQKRGVYRWRITCKCSNYLSN